MLKIKTFLFLFISLVFCFNSLSAETIPLSFEETHRDKAIFFEEYSEIITVNEDRSYVKEDYKRLKIQKEESRWMGEIPICYEKGRQEVTELTAHTITPDGKRHAYTNIQDMNICPDYPEYSDAMVKIVTMPEVNAGSVIEYKSIIYTKKPQIENTFWEDSFLLSNTPTKLLRFKISFPKKLNIRYKEFNVKHKPAITEDDSTITYAWEIQDVYDSRKKEKYTPPPTLDDILEGIEFSSIADWKDVSNWYYALVEKNLIITPEIETATRKAVEGKTSVRDRTRAIVEYIQDNFRYVSMSFGAYSLEPHPTDEVFRNKYGDCKDLSLLLKAMLKVAGVESDLALFQDEFSISDPRYDLPIPSLFDHVLVLVRDEKNEEFYVDPLLKGFDIGEYPINYQCAYTFVITKDGGNFGRLPVFPEERNTRSWVMTEIINPDGSTISEQSAERDLETSISTRAKIKSLDESEKEEMFKTFDSMASAGGEVIEKQIYNLDKRYGRLTSHSKIRQRDAYLISDGLIVLEISGYSREIELLKEKRESPVFFSINSREETKLTYQIPPGFRVLSLPENIEKDIGVFSMNRTYEKKGDKIIINETMRLKRAEIPVDEYPKVKEFFDKLPRDTYQRIVLKKTRSLWHEIKNWIWQMVRKGSR